MHDRKATEPNVALRQNEAIWLCQDFYGVTDAGWKDLDLCVNEGNYPNPFRNWKDKQKEMNLEWAFDFCRYQKFNGNTESENCGEYCDAGQGIEWGWKRRMDIAWVAVGGENI